MRASGRCKVSLVSNPETAHIVRAFEAVALHEPEWERCFLQHTLVKALQEPDLVMNLFLGEALMLLPSHFRGLPYDASEDVQSGITRLIEVAERDPRFLKNFLDGKPCEPFFSDDLL